MGVDTAAMSQGSATESAYTVIMAAPSAALDASTVPLVYIVILNWNGWRDTLQCLAAIEDLDYTNYHVLVVDNGSTDDSESQIHAAFPRVEVIQSGGNLGYAGGNNVGIRRALNEGANYVLLVNPDVVISRDTLRALVDTAEGQVRAGALCPLIRYKDSPEAVWFGGGVIDWRGSWSGHNNDATGPISPTTPAFRSSPWASGCCLLLSATALREVGLLDVRYFLYYEETDLCQRFLAQGFAVGVCIQTSAYHQPAAAVGAMSPRYTYYLTRNSLLFFLRYAPVHGISRWQVLRTLSKRYFLKYQVIMSALKRDPATLAMLRAFLDITRGRFGRARYY